MPHNPPKPPEYAVWKGMIARCIYPSSSSFKYYGGRGIKVCKRWESFDNFYSDMGHRPGNDYSIDRYPNKDGHYEPGNCRWATNSQQVENVNETNYLEKLDKPTEIVVDLPLPPSVNSIWRRGTNRKTGRVFHHKSTQYTKWIKSVGEYLMAQKPPGGFKTIAGPFEIGIVINRKMSRSNSDIDNRIKSVLDAMQHFEIVTNDRFATRLIIEYGSAVYGARITVRPCDYAE